MANKKGNLTVVKDENVETVEAATPEIEEGKEIGSADAPAQEKKGMSKKKKIGIWSGIGLGLLALGGFVWKLLSGGDDDIPVDVDGTVE